MPDSSEPQADSWRGMRWLVRAGSASHLASLVSGRVEVSALRDFAYVAEVNPRHPWKHLTETAE